MSTKESCYTWHFSLRVDRPVEGCALRSHAYMYGKKLDDRGAANGIDNDQYKKSNSSTNLSLHAKTSKEAPPPHEFQYRWFRGPEEEFCAYADCPRRKSFSPHDWSMHALGGSGCSLQCVSVQSSLYKATFCNSNCFVRAWKTQYTVNFNANHSRGGANGNGGGGPHSAGAVNTPQHKRADYIDDDASAGSIGATSTSSNQNPYQQIPHHRSNNSTLTPRRRLGSGGSIYDTHQQQHHHPHQYNNNHHISNSNDSTLPPPQSFQQIQQEWIEIGQNSIYIPTQQDVGRKLKLDAYAISTETGETLMHRLVTTDLVLSRAPDPVKRNLVTTKPPPPHPSTNTAGERFRIVTYNVLAEIYATQQQYPYTDFWALSWDYRFQNLLRELLDARPDVICLQEVQADHYETHVYAALSDAGFEGVYKQKTRAAMGIAGKVDGCALFWRRAKFHLVESYSIEFNELAQRQATQVLGMNPRSDEFTSYLNRLSKDNVAQLVVLESATPSPQQQQQQQRSSSSGRGGGVPNQVCIANTHLYSNKDFPDVKLWQTWQLLQELETFVMSRGTNLPLMICGDFNSTPDTAVYDLLSRQQVYHGHPDVNMSNGGDDGGGSPNILPDTMSITHSFQLGSVYHTVMGEEPKATNFTVSFKGVLDYMWYSASNLRPLSTAPIPDEESLTRHGEALPSTQYSSDHIMMIADMQIVVGGGGGGGGRPPS